MTTQKEDDYYYLGEKYFVIEINGAGLFKPEELGLETFSVSTNCWRGYVLTYIITNDNLILDKMVININSPIKLNNVVPEKIGSEGPRFFEYRYENLNLKIEFSGTIVLGKDRVDYEDSWNTKPVDFAKVFEIYLEIGNITKIKNISRKLEKERNQNFIEKLSEAEAFIYEKLKENDGNLNYKKLQELCLEKIGNIRLKLMKMKEKRLLNFNIDDPETLVRLNL